MTTQTWILAAAAGLLLGLLALAVGGPAWAIAMGVVGGFLIVLLTIGLRD